MSVPGSENNSHAEDRQRSRDLNRSRIAIGGFQSDRRQVLVILGLIPSLLASSMSSNNEYDPLLENARRTSGREANGEEQQYHEEDATGVRATIWGVLTLLVVGALVFLLFFQDRVGDWAWSDRLPKDPILAALKILETAPVIVRGPITVSTRDMLLSLGVRFGS